MTIYFATDHAGFELKNILLEYVRDELGYEVEDCGALDFDENDDYPVFIKKAAEAVAESPEDRKAIVLGGSGQGEAIVANRHAGVRAVVYYGKAKKEQIDVKGHSFSVLESSRIHNDANVLSLGARFIETDDAKSAVKTWIETAFTEKERNIRRIQMIDNE